MISSSQNNHFKRWKSLHLGKGIKKNQQFLLFGQKTVKEAKKSPQWKIIESLHWKEIEEKTSYPQWILSKDLFHEIDLFGTNSEILVIETPQLQTWQPNNKNEGVTLLCPLGDPANLGALIRSAAAFNVRNFVLLKEAANPFHPKAIRSASGSIFLISLSSGPSLHQLSPEKNWFSLDMNGEDINQITWPKNPFLLIGEEGPGVPEIYKEQTQKIKIPMSKDVESLNAAVAASIALFKIQEI